MSEYKGLESTPDNDNTLIGPEPELIMHNKPGVLEKTAAMYIAHFKLDADATSRDLRVGSRSKHSKGKPKSKPKSKPKDDDDDDDVSVPMDDDDDDY